MSRGESPNSASWFDDIVVLVQVQIHARRLEVLGKSGINQDIRAIISLEQIAWRRDAIRRMERQLEQVEPHHEAPFWGVLVSPCWARQRHHMHTVLGLPAQRSRGKQFME